MLSNGHIPKFLDENFYWNKPFSFPMLSNVSIYMPDENILK